MITYVLFAIGFVLLIKGADILVEGSSSIAKKYHLSELVIGLTIVSFGTSMPELIVNLMASFSGSAELAVGNVLGSNIANILLILGFSAVIRPLPIQRSIYFSEIPIMLVATFMLGFLSNANLFHPDATGLALSRYDGFILLVFFGLFMAYIYVVSKSSDDTIPNSEGDSPTQEFTMGKSILMITGGMIGLFLGGKWIVDGAIAISAEIGLSESFIGLTVVAIGTSLPELVTSVMASIKNKADMAIGNVVGSNIFNIFWILGLSAAIRPIPFFLVNNDDILVMIGASTLLIFAVINGKKAQLSRGEGILFILLYLGYMVYLIMRG